jgi:aryl-alcohol dehydrogenase-like predicted oxidoreductase
MEQRQLGASGFRVPVLTFGTATFGGTTDFFKAWGTQGEAEATRMVDLCLDAGVTAFDTANVYSVGRSEELLGAALSGRRDRAIVATKGTFPMGEGPLDYGSSRGALVRACEDSLRRLRTDWIDLYYLHGFDDHTPVEESLRALDDLVRAGKIRYIGCSNFSGWHLMKALAASDRHGWSRYVAHQVCYSLAARDVEWELLPLAADQGVGTVIWSALAGGALTGKVRRGQPAPADSRIGQLGDFVPVEGETLFSIVDALETVARDLGRSLAQVALNWAAHPPTVSSVVIGARNEEQLRQNLGAIGWKLDPHHLELLDRASAQRTPYPIWHQQRFPMLRRPPG